MTKKVVIYGRTSTTKNQSVDHQLRELREISKRNDWEIVEEYLDKGISGSLGRDGRPSFDRLLKDVNRKKFDGILVWSIDRLGRSLQDLVSFLNDVQSKNIDLYIHQQGLDTSTPTGKMMFQMCGVFAEFERNIIRERVKSGMENAKINGTKSGRPIGRPSMVNSSTKTTVVELLDRGMSKTKVCKTLSIGVGTLYKLLDEVA
jgi:DNA invertase Pin-like site-specific DNA recombinase